MSDQILITDSQSVNPGRIIPLTQGYVAVVDDDDYERINKYRWKAMKVGKNGIYIYATRTKMLATVLGKRKSKEILMHREIVNAQDEQLVDHWDHNGLNNRRYNLRICTQTQNHGNALPRGGSSRFKGVYWVAKRRLWQAQIGRSNATEGQSTGRYLGRYENEEDAALAYDRAAREYFGEFALTNFDEDDGREIKRSNRTASVKP